MTYEWEPEDYGWQMNNFGGWEHKKSTFEIQDDDGYRILVSDKMDMYLEIFKLPKSKPDCDIIMRALGAIE